MLANLHRLPSENISLLLERHVVSAGVVVSGGELKGKGSLSNRHPKVFCTGGVRV